MFAMFSWCIAVCRHASTKLGLPFICDPCKKSSMRTVLVQMCVHVGIRLIAVGARIAIPGHSYREWFGHWAVVFNEAVEEMSGENSQKSLESANLAE